MNKVDLYVNGFRLDLFDDEEITINLSVQNVQDISKVFTDFTQGFTVPASPRNNEILQHYYNSNITNLPSPPRQVVAPYGIASASLGTLGLRLGMRVPQAQA
jgi:hypothetical protein